MPTITEAMAEGAKRLREAGVSEARRTAGILLCNVLTLDRTALLTRSNENVEDAAWASYSHLIARRAAGEPLQYITGHQEFYGLDFNVTPDVLIPRPETESLVERVIAVAAALPRAAECGPLIVDVGTGSGCVAVAVAVNVPSARVIATDISPSALEVARENALRHGVSSRIEFLEGDLLGPLKERGLAGAIDIIACNPPYVPSSQPDTVQREVREWEPNVALFGGEEGLDFYGRLFDDAGEFLKAGGYLVCEIGYSQLDSIREMISATWELMEVRNDLQGIPRTIAIRKRESE
ncbi:MAG TPA: peptide chain release factor N(5)-glutamine methyltransferase [Blastocatellia bacterium]|nr:peptide chain release factor N(5)-glutamine methyltransferase [Blastocatellia bacterium]